ncbi:MAG TPA: TMEM175 family protein [Chitinophagaceae bacterium]|nr:TMEM175 family protein [Chitinophagaceae bacterium]
MNQEKLSMSAGRLEALGDGIFSVVMTVLVIELKIPHIEGNSFHDFWSGLYEIRQELFCFFISFVVLGIMWFGHRMVFEYISRTNRYFIFLGVLFYMIVCLVPFSTKFLAVNTLKWYAILTYGLNLSMCNMSLYAQWTYGIRRPSLHSHPVPPEVKKEAGFLFLISPILYATAIVLSFFFPWASIFIYFITPILYLIPNKLDKYFP